MPKWYIYCYMFKSTPLIQLYGFMGFWAKCWTGWMGDGSKVDTPKCLIRGRWTWKYSQCLFNKPNLEIQPLHCSPKRTIEIKRYFERERLLFIQNLKNYRSKDRKSRLKQTWHSTRLMENRPNVAGNSHLYIWLMIDLGLGGDITHWDLVFGAACTKS